MSERHGVHSLSNFKVHNLHPDFHDEPNFEHYKFVPKSKTFDDYFVNKTLKGINIMKYVH